MVVLNEAGRLPTGKELEAFGEAFKEKTGVSDEEVNELQLWATVFDHYITDGPGYVGKVLVVVYSGSPDFYEAYCEREGKWEYMPQGF